MKIKDIALHLAKKESLKKQINIAQIKEVLGHLAELISSDADALLNVIAYGNKRTKKKKLK